MKCNGENMFLTKKCPNCGNLVREDAAFCLDCGAMIKSEESVETEAPATETGQSESPAPSFEEPVKDTPAAPAAPEAPLTPPTPQPVPTAETIPPPPPIQPAQTPQTAAVQSPSTPQTAQSPAPPTQSPDQAAERPAPSPVSARLAIVKGAREGTEFPLTSAQITIGRSKAGNDLVLNDPQASRNHAVISMENGVYTIKDLQSTNGTIVNGRQITSRVLVDGDVIEIGDTVLVFHG